MFGSLLECGHYATATELRRYGPEAWCWVCCNWQLKVEKAS